MEIEQHAADRGAEAAAARMDGAETTGEARRMRISDPEMWHDLAERGTPRNG